MKRIAFFIHRFSSGGAEKMTILLANELAHLGYDVTFIVRENSGEAKYLINNSIKIVDLQLGMPSKIVKNIKNVCLLKKELQNNYDVCFSVTTSMSLVASITNCLMGNKVKLISVIHNTISSEKRSFASIRNHLIKLFDKFTIATVVVSKDAAQDYIKTCKVNENKITTIYNPVISENVYSLSEMDPQHEWLINERDFKVIINAGRLSYQKNQELLIKSLKKMREKEDIRLIILGVGELEQELKDLCINLDIAEYVDFHGYTQNPYAYFAKADTFVLSSRYEGLPTVLIEALGCGCKIVSTDCPSGPREILDNGRFGILATQDEESLVHSIEKSLKTTVNKEILKEYSKNFSVEKSVQKYVELIEMV